jgi:hypothetical protein
MREHPEDVGRRGEEKATEEDTGEREEREKRRTGDDRAPANINQ